MDGTYPIECLHCPQKLDSHISNTESVNLMWKHIREEHPDKVEAGRQK